MEDSTQTLPITTNQRKHTTWLLTSVIIVLLITNIYTYYLSKRSYSNSSTPEEMISIASQHVFEPLLTNTDATIVSMSNGKKLVVLSSTENPHFDSIYLSDISLNHDTTTKLIDTFEGNSSGGKVGQIFTLAPTDGSQIFLITISGTDGGPDYAIIKDDGTVVSDSIVFTNQDSSQYNYAFIEYHDYDHQKPNQVIMSLTNRGVPGSMGNEEIYFTDLDLTTGKLGSLRTEARIDN